MSSSSSRKATIYFGYGSNLWQHQMRSRCPTSKYLGIARLKGYKWIIYSRGYANIVELTSKSSTDKHDYTHEVWGLVYALQPSDEEGLDGNEGVPYAYTKESIPCEFWPAEKDSEKDEPEEKDMLVYINRKDTKEAKSKKEYVHRMNMGIKDAIEEGVPKEYVEQVLRMWIPEVEDQELEKQAQRQALEFEDER